MSTVSELLARLDSLPQRLCHRDVELYLGEVGWKFAGAGDWAVALQSPDRELAARISPFDPVGPYTAQFYREAATTLRVPELFAHRRLLGGGDLQIMQWLAPVQQHVAATFLESIRNETSEFALLHSLLAKVHSQAIAELPWCGPLDDNPNNVMKAGDGRLMLVDPFYADGPNLYGTALEDPELLACRIRQDQRLFMTEIPLAGTGGWDPGVQEQIRAGLALADAATQ